jgi:hypothetical protein
MGFFLFGEEKNPMGGRGASHRQFCLHFCRFLHLIIATRRVRVVRSTLNNTNGGRREKQERNGK